MFDQDEVESVPRPAPVLTDSDRLCELLALVPAARCTTEFVRLNPRTLSTGERIDLLAMLEEQRNWLDSVQVRLVSEIERADGAARWIADTLAEVLRIERSEAETRLAHCRMLTGRLPATLARMTKGDITRRQAEVVAAAADRLAPELLARFEERVLAGVGRQTSAEFERTVARVAAEFGTAPNGQATDR